MTTNQADAEKQESLANNEYDYLLDALYLALIEIRAAQTLEDAQILADVLHNVPHCIRARNPTQSIDEMVSANAERHENYRSATSLLKQAKARSS